jgi:hypothetical protein
MSSCPKSWAQANGSFAPDGFLQFVEGPTTLVVEGCGAPTATGFPFFALNLWTPPQNLGSTKAFTLSFTPSAADTFVAASDDITTFISEMDPQGGFIAGTLQAHLVSPTTGAVKDIGGTFKVCHIRDSMLGPY